MLREYCVSVVTRRLVCRVRHAVRQAMRQNSEATVRLMEGKDRHGSLSIYTRLLLPSDSKYKSVSCFQQSITTCYDLRATE